MRLRVSPPPAAAAKIGRLGSTKQAAAITEPLADAGRQPLDVRLTRFDSFNPSIFSPHSQSSQIIPIANTNNIMTVLRNAVRSATASTSRAVATPALSGAARPAIASTARLAPLPTVNSNRLYHDKVIDHVSVSAIRSSSTPLAAKNSLSSVCLQFSTDSIFVSLFVPHSMRTLATLVPS